MRDVIGSPAFIYYFVIMLITLMIVMLVYTNQDYILYTSLRRLPRVGAVYTYLALWRILVN